MILTTIARYFLFFIIGSFVGWLVEEIVVFLQTHKIMNRGFLIGPVLPIYGVGALVGALILNHLSFSPVLVFLVAAIGAGALEYFASLILEKTFGARWWDYSDRPFNIHGRVCLLYIISFGIMGLLMAYLIWPNLYPVLFGLDSTFVLILSAVLFLVFVVDFFTSWRIIKDFKKITREHSGDDTEAIAAHVREALSESGRLHRRLTAFNFIIYSPKVLYYNDFTDDFVESRGQDYHLPSNYKWIRSHSLPVLYFIFSLWARLHRLIHGIKYENTKILKKYQNTAYFIYANHTQPLSDILAPADYCRPHRVRFLASPANLAIPVIGNFLPDLGALPVPSDLHDFVKLEAAIKHYYDKGDAIVIYPEAHVWPWYTGIRPLPVSAFSYPARLSAPVFTATTIYKKRRFGRRKPKMIIRLDGPFYADPALGRRAATRALHDQVAQTLAKNAKKSNYDYIKYEKSHDKA